MYEKYKELSHKYDFDDVGNDSDDNDDYNLIYIRPRLNLKKLKNDQ